MTTVNLIHGCMEITLKPVAFVKNSRKEPIDDNWASITAEIVLADDLPTETLLNIGHFSHLEIIYYFDKVQPGEIVFFGHPRGNKNYPPTGIFGQRKKDRPNAIGLATVELVAHHGRTLTVNYLDAIDGTPVLDIKPVMKEFEPNGEIRQPEWVSDLMKQYW